jgi:hypothetical protein
MCSIIFYKLSTLHFYSFFYKGCFWDAGTCYVKATSCGGYGTDRIRCDSDLNGIQEGVFFLFKNVKNVCYFS